MLINIQKLLIYLLLT